MTNAEARAERAKVKEFLDALDLEKHIPAGKDLDAYKLQCFLEEHYHYPEKGKHLLFNVFDTDDFVSYLCQRFGGKISAQRVELIFVRRQ